jgi:hypothetical protein
LAGKQLIKEPLNWLKSLIEDEVETDKKPHLKYFKDMYEKSQKVFDINALKFTK